ncbi:response regulator receiver protein [Shewanella halifaxensis HAW-EB4]|uniref:Response regulator receiver protein n=1 Tax=Shewanella halifaxensis (strain HAW-EB4) TaxID=458817 RepID=B0TS92_SHEHH|nr:response regulator [Shewanella halifaxensis]ABZ76472.1 response regulator receiver protein [Shewanella halifaxensis HAW-EB4]
MKKARILVVDDDPVCSSLLLSILGDDYQVTTVNTGCDVADIANIQRPDVIFLDIMMPGKNGYQVLKDLKQDPQTSKLPVIIVSALSEQSDENLALRIGADGYITKPIVPSSVFAVLKKYL